jgi:hypothetical protein
MSDLSKLTALGSYGWVLRFLRGRAGLPSYAAWVGSGSGDLEHGVVEGQLENLDKEVDGVTFQAASVPVPIGFLDDEAGEGGQLQVARLLLDPACWPPCALCIALTLWGQNN